MFLEDSSLQRLFRDVIQREGDFLILIPLHVFVAQNIRFFLGSNHAAHQFHRRVVLSAIALALCLDGHILQHLRVCLHLNIQPVTRGTVHGNRFCGIANSRHGEHLPVMAGNLEVSVSVSNGMHLEILIGNCGKRDCVPRLLVSDVSRNLRSDHQRAEAT